MGVLDRIRQAWRKAPSQERTNENEEREKRNEAWSALGNRLDKLKEVKREVEKELRRNPNNSEAWCKLGHAYQRYGSTTIKYERAAECFEKAVALDPQSAKAWASLAFAYFALGKYSASKAAEARARALGYEDCIL